MILTIKDRLLLGTILPEKGDITTLRLLRQLREALSFTEDEHAALGFQTENGLTRWNSDAPQEADIPMGPKAQDIVRGALKAASDAKALTDDFVGLWDKFNPEG